jgi:thioredoxin 1
MAAIELTKENFSDVVGGAELALVDFWGPRCRSCRAFDPVFEEASRRHPDAVFGKVETEAHSQLAAMFRVMSLPTLVIMKEGFVIYARSGPLPLEDLEDLLGQARALDMGQVRRKRAAGREAADGGAPGFQDGSRRGRPQPGARRDHGGSRILRRLQAGVEEAPASGGRGDEQSGAGPWRGEPDQHR